MCITLSHITSVLINRPICDSITFVPPLLEVRNLNIAFRSDTGERPVVRDVNISIAEGEVFGLVGESGSGKSVTSLAILRLLGPNARVEGNIAFDGTELLTLPEDAMRQRRGRDIAMIFQEPMTALNPVMRVGRQIAEAVTTHERGISRVAINQRVAEVLDAVALPVARSRDYPHQFSGGQRQRIMIAMALVNRPRLLIADEPTTALDVTVQAQVLDLLASLRERYKLAMLFISHDLAVVGEVAQRVAVMRYGQILECGTRDQIFGRPQHAYTRSLLGAVPTLTTPRDRPLATVGIESSNAATALREIAQGHFVRTPL
ncbi:MAG TPA: ABC transporter ATP-binding protein [Acidobacteriaceae bacterium]|nr:ABC transporter ATP-binding protein [Acidobacteriaceae bacterium]